MFIIFVSKVLLFSLTRWPQNSERIAQLFSARSWHKTTPLVVAERHTSMSALLLGSWNRIQVHVAPSDLIWSSKWDFSPLEMSKNIYENSTIFYHWISHDTGVFTVKSHWINMNKPLFNIACPSDWKAVMPMISGTAVLLLSPHHPSNLCFPARWFGLCKGSAGSWYLQPSSKNWQSMFWTV